MKGRRTGKGKSEERDGGRVRNGMGKSEERDGED